MKKQTRQQTVSIIKTDMEKELRDYGEWDDPKLTDSEEKPQSESQLLSGTVTNYKSLRIIKDTSK